MKSKRIILCSSLILIVAAAVSAETAPEVEWDNTFSGSSYDWVSSVQQTSDGGYILTGDAISYLGGNHYVWLIKTYPNGNKEWDKTFGNSGSDYASSVQQTSDGGYILAGGTSSLGPDTTYVWLIKTDSSGNQEWNKTFGGSDSDHGNSAQQTSDGGYILAGDTKSFGAGNSDIWLIKTDPDGNEEWNKTFGGSDIDRGYSVQQTSDGGYIIAGETFSFGAGYSDFWLIKTDPDGKMEWDNTFGGSYIDIAYSIQQTFDGGYILAGDGDHDCLLVKTDSNGNEEWIKTFGGSDYFDDDICYSAQQTSDGGYILAGGTKSFGAGEWDFWLIKTDSNGNKEWDKTLGGSEHDWAKSVQQTSDGGYIVAGDTQSFGAGNLDIWLIKLKGDVIGVEDQNNLPENYSLSQNFPNPFNPTTTISYSIAKPGNVSIEVFDILGQKVTTLFDGQREAGTYSINWDAAGQANGIYIAVMKAGGIIKKEKMMMVK